jgi:hypothetical protein
MNVPRKEPCLVDDLLSGMASRYSVAMSIPLLGADLTMLLWAAPYPGDPAFESRMYIAHVLILPVAIAVLLSIHIALIAMRHHTQFRRRVRQTERTLVGVPTFPGQTPRSLGPDDRRGGGDLPARRLVQINPLCPIRPSASPRAGARVIGRTGFGSGGAYRGSRQG